MMKRLVVIVVSVGLLVILAALAAFVGGGLLNAGEQASEGENVRVVGGDGGSAVISQRVPFRRAPELPKLAPAAFGLLTRREDDRLLIGTGTVEMTVDEDGKENATHSGPVVEVVVTRDTRVYREVFQDRENDSSGPLEQKVTPGSADEVRVGALVSAWGEKRGDRVVADVLVYSSQ